MNTHLLNAPSYVGQRGELLARIFLEDLHPDFLALATAKNVPYDFLLGFYAKDGSLKQSAVEVKATEREVKGRYAFSMVLRTLDGVRTSNVPTLFLVIDVKRTRYYYNWARQLPPASEVAPDGSSKSALVSLPMIALDDEGNRKALLKELRG